MVVELYGAETKVKLIFLLLFHFVLPLFLGHSKLRMAFLERFIYNQTVFDAFSKD